MTVQQQFSQALEPLHLLKHPFYQDWMQGTLSVTVLKDYASQYLTHVEAFPRYISAIHSLSENPTDRKILLENLNDEEGFSRGDSHPELWLQFGEGLGLQRNIILETLPRAAIQKVVDTFFYFARSSFHEGLGALYAYERQIPEIATSKIQGLKEHYAIQDESTLKFFKVHETADLYHREAVEKILASLPPRQKEEALVAAQTAAQTLWDFLSDVHGNNSNVSN